MIKPAFIVRYAGAAIKFSNGFRDVELVDDLHATVFPRWSAAHEAGLLARLNYRWLAIEELSGGGHNNNKSDSVPQPVAAAAAGNFSNN